MYHTVKIDIIWRVIETATQEKPQIKAPNVNYDYVNYYFNTMKLNYTNKIRLNV